MPGGRNSLSEAKSCLTADTSVLIFVTVIGVQAPLRAVIFATTGLTMTASAPQLLQNLPHTTLKTHVSNVRLGRHRPAQARLTSTGLEIASPFTHVRWQERPQLA